MTNFDSRPEAELIQNDSTVSHLMQLKGHIVLETQELRAFFTIINNQKRISNHTGSLSSDWEY